MHDGLIIILCVQISDEVILILIEIMLPSCEERVTLSSDYILYIPIYTVYKLLQTVLSHNTHIYVYVEAI